MQPSYLDGKLLFGFFKGRELLWVPGASFPLINDYTGRLYWQNGLGNMTLMGKAAAAYGS
jgi:hypothetical protein